MRLSMSCLLASLLVPATGIRIEADDTAIANPASQVAVIDILADANRDGQIDASDDEGEEIWSDLRGALFLANIDDDDGDHELDAEDSQVNGVDDRKDLARIQVVPWTQAPEGTVGVLVLDDDSAPHVRIHKYLPQIDTWIPLLGRMESILDIGDGFICKTTAKLTLAEVAAGVELGIEGLHLRTSKQGWGGFAKLRYFALDAAGALVQTEKNPIDGRDELVMRVAPWVMLSNLHDHQDVYCSLLDHGFANRLRSITTAAGRTFHGIPVQGPGSWNNRWVQDWFQTGYSAMPGPGGAVHCMFVSMPRPQKQGDPGDHPLLWLMQNYLGADKGVCNIHDAPGRTGYDSYGNHELIPPHGDYPNGRIVHGSPPQDSAAEPGMRAETAIFYAAQDVQVPTIGLDTSWLEVGHIDEVFIFVPAGNTRGWKLLVAAPALCEKLLATWKGQGFGDRRMFVGKLYGSSTAGITTSDLLDDSDLVTLNQKFQAQIDLMLDALVAEVDLGSNDIVELPFWFEAAHVIHNQKAVALHPNTVNSLVLGDHIVAPDPFGPEIANSKGVPVDGFKDYLANLLGTPGAELGSDGQGLQVHFIDDWNTYHYGYGEVHCAANLDRPQTMSPWWEVAQ